MYSVDTKNPGSWDEYFFEMCKTVASNSKCLSRKIGAVIVKDKTIISTGYNGPPRNVRSCDERWLVDKGLRDVAEFTKKYAAQEINKGLHPLFLEEDLNYIKGKCPRKILNLKSGQGLEWCIAGHAERNAIVNAAREGMPSLKNTKIYMSCGIPCTPCLVEIINAGINEIICTDFDFYDKSGQYLLKESGIKTRIFNFMED